MAPHYREVVSNLVLQITVMSSILSGCSTLVDLCHTKLSLVNVYILKLVLKNIYLWSYITVKGIFFFSTLKRNHTVVWDVSVTESRQIICSYLHIYPVISWVGCIEQMHQIFSHLWFSIEGGAEKFFPQPTYQNQRFNSQTWK